MIYLTIIAVAVALMLQNVLKQIFKDRSRHGTVLFSAVISAFALLFFLAVNREWKPDVRMLPYAIGFGVCYLFATVFAVLAIGSGSLAKTSLILSYSLLIPGFYGILFLGEPVSCFLVIGLCLLAVSLFLINYQKEQTPQTVSWRWILYVLLAFFGNGLCSVIQKAEQTDLGEGGQNLFMIFALTFCTVSLLISSSFFKKERGNGLKAVRGGWWLAGLCGILNGLVNFWVLYLNPRIPSSILFPLVSGGSMILILLWSFLVKKERFSVRQTVGFVIGIASIVILNIG